MELETIRQRQHGPGVEVRTILIVNSVITALSAAGGLAMILPYLLCSEWRQKTRHKLILGLGISDICTALAVLIPSIQDLLRTGEMKSGSARCQADAFFYEATVLTSSFWTIGIAVVTYITLARPMSFCATILTRPWCFPILFTIVWIAGCIIAGIGISINKMEDVEGFCFYGTRGSAYGQLSLFVPRQDAFAVVSDPRSNLETIMSHGNPRNDQTRRASIMSLIDKTKCAITSSSSSSRKGSKDSDGTLVAENKGIQKFSTASEKLKAQNSIPGVTVTVPKPESVVEIHSSGVSPRTSLALEIPSAEIFNQPVTPNLNLPHNSSKTEDFLTINRANPQPKAWDSSFGEYSFSNFPGAIKSIPEPPSPTTLLPESTAFKDGDLHSELVCSKQNSLLPTPTQIYTPIEESLSCCESPRVKRKSVTIQNTIDFAPRNSCALKHRKSASKRLSGQALNRRASLLMLLYPAAIVYISNAKPKFVYHKYTALFSVSLGRLVIEMSHEVPSPHMRAVSSFVEWTFRRRGGQS
ncbi:expressed protein [Phakopsora pachyrhizi]|uniref:Expressed protein n=1 Tax=Phakopsora pachyrhizi TaxID=170000 RepID=A0AAV0B1X2_PHAPC|nr:expressed protein [Phakopsora pachyrhizi]